MAIASSIVVSVGDVIEEVPCPPPGKIIRVPSTELGQQNYEVPFSVLYFVALIVDLTLSLIAGIAIGIAIFVLTQFNQWASEFSYKNVHFAVSNSMKIYSMELRLELMENATDMVVFLRWTFLALYATTLVSQIFGWNGLNYHHVKSVLIFGFIRGISAVVVLVILCLYGLEVVPFTLFVMNIVFMITSFVFAYKLSVHRWY